MKTKLTILLAALFCLTGLTSTANAVSVSVSVGDRPYYSHGPGYWDRGAYMVWVPGHWGWRHHHHVWVHGHYLARR